MRVTTWLSRQQRIEELMRQEARLEEARDRVSSGRRITRPSDAPGEIAALLRIRSHLADVSRRRAEADLMLPFMRAGEATLGEIGAAVREARTLALQANNAAASVEQRQSLAEQVGRLRERVLDLANTRISGRYLFGGRQTQTPPFIAGPPVAYAGDSEALSLNLYGDALFPASLPGERMMGAPESATTLFQELADLEKAIEAGDHAAIAAGLDGLERHLNHLIRLRGEMGARIQYVERRREQLEEDRIAGEAAQSRLQDVDLAAAVIEARTAEAAHAATLLVVAGQQRSSLLDYLG